MSTGPVTVAPFRGDVMLTVTVFAAWASAAGGSKATVHNASTTAAIDVLTLVTSCWQLSFSTHAGAPDARSARRVRGRHGHRPVRRPTHVYGGECRRDHGRADYRGAFAPME